MPKCKNDPKRSYKGTEPSPKGIGYCAHAEKSGSKKKGKDGNMWIIKEVKGSKRWFKYSKDNSKPTNKNIMNLYNHLEKKISKFWYQTVSEYNFIIINKDNSCKKISSKMKSLKARYNELDSLMKKYSNDKDVRAILTSGPSGDNLTFFIFYLLTKAPIKIVENILQTKDITNYMCQNYKLFFRKRYVKGKEFMFKWNNKITFKELQNNNKYVYKFKKIIK